MSNESTYLFSRPSFLKGMGRVLDMGGTINIYNTSNSEVEADKKALKNDWYAIGNDFDIILKQYE